MPFSALLTPPQTSTLTPLISPTGEQMDKFFLQLFRLNSPKDKGFAKRTLCT